jgi:hypothetical protein
MKGIITFDNEAKIDMLEFFDKTVDKEGYIIEKSTGQKILASDGDYLELAHFAGIKKGSLVFVKKDINSIIELSDSVDKNDK